MIGSKNLTAGNPESVRVMKGIIAKNAALVRI
jgi:hypothetical protein